MPLWLRAVLLGLLSWFVPFMAGFAAFPLKKTNAPLFSTIPYLVVLLTAGALLSLYFRKRRVTLLLAARLAQR